MLPPFDLPEEIFLLVTDEKPSPADFILHQALISQLKASLQCIVLSVSESQARWKAIVSKNVRICKVYLKLFGSNRQALRVRLFPRRIHISSTYSKD